jgi:small subunit ribosomal protein S20
MAQHASAEKQARKAAKRRLLNRHYMSSMKTALKRVKDAKEKEKAQDALKKAVKVLDQLAAKGIIHKNKAANQKSQLTKFVKAMK